MKAHPHGHVFDDEVVTVQPKDPACTARLELADSAMLTKLGDVARETDETTPDFAYRLVPRRLPDVYNSFGRSHARLMRKFHYNPAFMYPDDLEALAVAPGELLEIRSSHGAILGVAEADAGLRRGLVSMTHAFGDLPGGDEAMLARSVGSNTGRLIPVDRDFDPHSGMPRMSALPVSVRRYAEPPAG